MEIDLKAWKSLEERCNVCEKCSLYKTKTNTVFGKGSKKPIILFVGEAPGEQEDLQGIPFCGASGQLLDKYFSAIDMSNDDYYVANILKCRPPNNRDPLPEEQEACIDFLREQFKLLQPKIIVCLGRIAAMQIIRPDYKITKEHGTWVKKGKYLMTAVYHPSLLLRDPSKREDMLKDMLKIEQMLRQIRTQS